MNETLSVYLNLNMEEEDEALIERIDQLLLTVGLKYIEIGTWTNVCPIEQIQTDRMKKPSPDKLQYYCLLYTSCCLHLQQCGQ